MPDSGVAEPVEGGTSTVNATSARSPRSVPVPLVGQRWVSLECDFLGALRLGWLVFRPHYSTHRKPRTEKQWLRLGQTSGE